MACIPKSNLILAFHVCFHEAESTPTPHLKLRAPERVGANCCLPASPCLPHTAPCRAKEWGTLLQPGHGANGAGLIESWNIYLNIAVPPTPPPESPGLRLSPFHRSPKTPWLALAGSVWLHRSEIHRAGTCGVQPHSCPGSLIPVLISIKL